MGNGNVAGRIGCSLPPSANSSWTYAQAIAAHAGGAATRRVAAASRNLGQAEPTPASIGSTRVRYLPYADASSEPNVIVDGTANHRTLITLSRWRRSGTPAALMADASTGIVFSYLDRPDLHVPAEAVSNNRFDEDGLVGIYTLLEPDAAASRRDP